MSVGHVIMLSCFYNMCYQYSRVNAVTTLVFTTDLQHMCSSLSDPVHLSDSGPARRAPAQQGDQDLTFLLQRVRLSLRLLETESTYTHTRAGLTDTHKHVTDTCAPVKHVIESRRSPRRHIHTDLGWKKNVRS